MAKAKNDSAARVEIKAVNMATCAIKIRGIDGPLVCHNWSSKAIRMMLEKQMSLKKVTKAREPKDPEQEYLDTLYFFKDSTRCGMPAAAFKKSIIRAAKTLKDTKQSDLNMILARQILFVHPDGVEDRLVKFEMGDQTIEHRVRNDLVEIAGEHQCRMDMVTVGMGTTDIRFRGEFPEWEATLRISYNSDILDASAIANLVYRAGLTVGIGEGRPEKNDQGWGRFEIVS